MAIVFKLFFTVSVMTFISTEMETPWPSLVAFKVAGQAPFAFSNMNIIRECDSLLLHVIFRFSDNLSF